ncbi:hypothetical protein [Brevundimonas sp. NPDC046655]|uniref:hypothetical protein n=1 Tax=unclassified Brevundimonas TaxID=2622653 RepID=UPI00384D9055
MDNGEPDISSAYVDGLATGEVIQFGTGDWRDRSVKGVAVSEDAFDRLEPAIELALSNWHRSARYDVTAIPQASLPALIEAIRDLAYDDAATTTMINEVIAWLSRAAAHDEQVSIFGL